MPPIETARFAGNLIIFEHPAAYYAYSPALDIYHIRDARFNDFSTYLNHSGFMALFNECFQNALEADRGIITMPFTSLMAKVVNVCLDKYFFSCRENWLAISFFHSDNETLLLSGSGMENPLEYKHLMLDSMLDYPYIKKLEIPYNKLLTFPALHQLIESAI
jgi:hypothetical protein